jgi:P27 family predicted phage terminase small subunit
MESWQTAAKSERASSKQKASDVPVTHLCPAAKAEWRRLAGQLTILQILTERDRAALAAYCQAYGRWVEAERKLHETPMLLKLPSGYVQQNPWLTFANKQLELMHKYLTDLVSRPSPGPAFQPRHWCSGRANLLVCLGRFPSRMNISATELVIVRSKRSSQRYTFQMFVWSEHSVVP